MAAVLQLALLLVIAEPDWRVLEATPGKPLPSEMLAAYLKVECHKALAARKAAYETLKTPEQIAEYQTRLRKFFLDRLGPLPERAPLNPRVVGSKQCDGYRFEKVIFESRPSHHVTAVLYLPAGSGPFPGVLVPCGHSVNGKAAEPYQRACILMAKNGLAVLCYDPIGQGERAQILTLDGKQEHGSTLEHTLVGVGAILVGKNTASFRIYDGLRAMDYLASRPEVDPKRLGCTGNSGGGTLTSYLMALDDRIACAAPSCYLTTFGRLIDTIGPQDAEQNIAGQLGAGLDHPDYTILRAPKPTLYCVATRDFFDIEGAWENFRQAKRIYGRLGFAERVDLIETDATHGFSSPLRTGAARWMRRWLLDRHEPIVEPDFSIQTDAELQCTPKGQVMLLDGERSVLDILADDARRLTVARKEQWSKWPREERRQHIRTLARIRKLADLPAPKATTVSTFSMNGVETKKLILETDSGVPLPGVLLTPEKPTGDPVLYANGAGKSAGAETIISLLKEGRVVLAVDLRGHGETAPKPDENKNFRERIGGDWKTFFLAYLIDRPLVGLRAEDILVSARYLIGRSAGKSTQVDVVAEGSAGVAALHAAAVEPRLFSQIKLIKTLETWTSLVGAKRADGALSDVVHGALAVYDLDLLREEYWLSRE